jgi:citrate lyase subunit beta/citryl-CoA lyase/(S)-citramalyl-CoA lyase
MYTRYCRSVLCTPATAFNRYAKCHGSGADICLVDLEDSVPPHLKDEARVKGEAFFSIATAAAVRCAIRINALTEPDGLRDLLALRRFPVKPGIVLIPKVESPRDVEIVEQVLGRTCPDLELFAVIETPRGVENTAAIAASSQRLRALIFGAADYAFALGIRLSWEPLAYARARVVVSARAANIDAIDSPTFELSDLTRLRHEATMAQCLGFSGKIALNPQQVPVINSIFSPDPEQLDAARRVVEAGKLSDHGVTAVDGVMVGRPFFEASRRLLEEFGPAATNPTMPSGET